MRRAIAGGMPLAIDAQVTVIAQLRADSRRRLHEDELEVLITAIAAEVRMPHEVAIQEILQVIGGLWTYADA